LHDAGSPARFDGVEKIGRNLIAHFVQIAIAAALAAVSGKSPAPQSLGDRLAALKARGGG